MACRASDAASAVTLPNRLAKGDNNLREDAYAFSLGGQADIPQANPTIPPFICLLENPSGVRTRLHMHPWTK